MEKNYIGNLPRAQAVSLKSLISVEPGQVSSLTLVQRPSLAMTLLSLDKGEAIGGHSSSGDALVVILSGTAEITIGDKKHTVVEGQSILMPADVPHSLLAVEAFRILLTVVKPEQSREGR